MAKDLISQNDNSTIVSEYIKINKEARGYQTEKELEKKFILDLEKQGYERLNINSLKELEPNLRKQLEQLNNIKFTDNEWKNFFKQVIENPNKNRSDKTEMIQADMHSEILERDNGTQKNIKFIDKIDIFKNSLQVISQIKNNDGIFKNRYDVTILVNGLPLVHIELKKRGVNLKEAFNQIKRYSRESFWAGNRLFEFVQIFVISNGTKTKYYSNSTRDSFNSSKNLNDNFAFCINFSDFKNNQIEDLEDFTKYFFAKRTLLNILTKFCVFNSEKKLLVMRPYQIAASESIINRINLAHNEKLYGTIDAGGYIWHSTGSGKTLTSFKTALLACKLDYIKKVIFVVDRRDLDYQTVKEYDKYQKGSANSTKNTEDLKKLIESDKEDHKIIITTIQKLSKFIFKYSNSHVFSQETVFIFDECHRSQFGSMHEQIKKKFKKNYIFGFTGTPIFEENAAQNFTTIKEKNGLGQIAEKATKKTTQIVFGKELHSYTIVNAISDGNVLPFRYEYNQKIKINKIDSKNEDFIKEENFIHPERISKIVKYVLDHFLEKTKRNNINDEKIGFNSIFATANVAAAKKYYLEFQKQIQNHKNKLKVGIIYSYEPNEDLDDDIDEGSDSPGSKEFLESAMKDYNSIFKSNFSLNNFNNYYKDVSQKLRDREIDILIVVNMFLTGFDSKTLNTLWVDKNLKHHGLLQSFSRTNRIFNEVKSFGNIICFRDLEQATNESIKMFGDKNSKDIILLKSFEDYLNGYNIDGQHYEGYKEISNILKQKFDLKNFPLKTEEEKKEFIKIFNKFLKLENILSVFDQFKQSDFMEEGMKQDYLSNYNEFYIQMRELKEKILIQDDISFEIELVQQIDINVDYIYSLLKNYNENKEKTKKYEILRAIKSSFSMQSSKDLIEKFLEEIDNNDVKNFDIYFKNFINLEIDKELQEIINKENLNNIKAKEFMEKAFETNKFQELGTDLDEVLPKIPLFVSNKEQQNLNQKKREEIIIKLKDFFYKFRHFKTNLNL